ncbi:MAG: hypothetical protein ACHP7I_00180 [Terriglobales bacterium]
MPDIPPRYHAVERRQDPCLFQFELQRPRRGTRLIRVLYLTLALLLGADQLVARVLKLLERD